MNLKRQNSIQPNMTVLDIVYTFKSTEAIFKKWDDKAGECICCNSLFDSLEVVAEKYGIELPDLLADLNRVVENS
ncbi:hypothetical protein JWG39_05190 [Desulforhopalus vacuolatus]|uniref:hypothetical protein n=1 Tax=Desulforhopalus vacuolatus TaxID=40414 RepID=UPI00196679B9|nr:hypothetical protein [Desulforhopalus vacuolatus]MBM9519214.1 hypothetical protein [Desulforhopalus vacuolatus]